MRRQTSAPTRSKDGGGGSALAADAAARCLDVIGSNLSALLGDAGRVEAAYAELCQAVALDPGRIATTHLRLAGLLSGSRSRAAPALFRLLATHVAGSPAPVPLLTALLAARDDTLRAEAVALATGMVTSGRVRPDLELAAALAAAVDEDATGTVLDDLAAVLEAVRDVRLPVSRGDPIGRLLEPSVPWPVRHLAARLLDRDGQPAPEARAVRVLGARGARELSHYLAYTRATHRDLVALVPGPSPCVSALDTILAAEAVLGRDRLAAALALLGWDRAMGGVTAEPVSVLGMEGSFPFVLRPYEARLAELAVQTQGRWNGWVVTALGSEDLAADPEQAGDAARIARFRSYSLDHAELLGEILEVAPVTTARCNRMLKLLDRVVSDYVALFSGIDAEAEQVTERYQMLREKVVGALETEADLERALPADVAYLFQAFEDPATVADVRTLHGLKRYLHQRGLRHAFRLFGSGGAANRTVDLLLLRDGHPPALVQQIRYIDFEAQEAPALPLAVRLVVDAYRAHLVHGITALPRVRVLVYGTEVQLYIWFRNHPAFIRIDLSPPRRGGMIDLEYFAVSQNELSAHPDLAVPAVQQALRRLGFFVTMDGTRLHARYDKERAVELSEIVDRAAALLRLAPRLMDLDWAIDALDLTRTDRDDTIDAWTDFLVRFGITPFNPAAPPGMPSGHVLRRLRRELRRLGIRTPAPVVAHARSGIGQLDLERSLLASLRGAIGRGEVLEEDGELRPAPRDLYRREHEALRFARLLVTGGRPLRRAVRIGAALRPMDYWLRFHVTGTVQGYPVERASLSCRDGDLTACVLRDEQGIIRLAFVTRGDVPYRVRARRRDRWERPDELTPSELLRLLIRDNYRSPETEGPVPAVERVADVVACFRVPNPRPPAPPLAGDRHVTGLAAAPGRASGFVRIGGPHRHPLEFHGAVLLAPTVEPADAPCLVHAAAAVSTGGGSLSHVGLLALELGRPSLIVDGTWRRAGDGHDVLVLHRIELRQRTRRVRSLGVSCWERVREHEDEVREGDLVVVDADDGTLRLLGSDRDALVLHQGLQDLDASTRAVADGADDAALLAARGDLLRVMHQLDRTVARMGQPVLAHYAVRELIAAQAMPGGAAGTRERSQLLDALCKHPRHGDAARAARTGAVDALVRRLRGLTAAARSTIPLLDGPLEVLFVRAAAVRLREGLLGIAAMYPPGDPAARGARHAARAAGALDPRTRERLATLRAELLREIGAGACARLRYALQAVDSIDRVLPPDDPPAGRALLDRARASVAAAQDAGRSRLAERFVIAADESVPGIEPWIGRKATMLAEIALVLTAGSVPPWFAVTNRAFRTALQSITPGSGHGVAAPLGAAIEAVLARADLEPARKSALIRDLWLKTPLPAELETGIADAYRTLATRSGYPDPFVAIRSSALEEDSPTGTWAGQFDTFLFVSGVESLLHHLRLAWAGLWSTRALYHRAPAGGRDSGPGGGILVQRMVDARVSGVVVTANPVAGEMRELVVNAGLGLGEGVVSGKVDADEIHVARNDTPGEPLRLRYRVADKRERVVYDAARGSGTRIDETLFHQRLRPALEYTELETLVDAAVALDRAFGEPLDVEFSLEGAKLWILQARPIPMFCAALAETIERFPLKESRG